MLNCAFIAKQPSVLATTERSASENEDNSGARGFPVGLAAITGTGAEGPHCCMDQDHENVRRPARVLAGRASKTSKCQVSIHSVDASFGVADGPRAAGQAVSPR